VGTILCLVVMFLMDYRTAIATYIIILLLYVLIRTRNPEANWGSSAQSLTFLNALKSVQSLEKVEDHVKNYRPKVGFGQIMTKPYLTSRLFCIY
jgi:solute carrier family 12 sodium/potassium/chloride transporter 2